MSNKITVLLELVTDKAQAAAKGFIGSFREAEGATNKFKAGASSAFSAVSANAGLLAASAGSALVAFGAKSVAAFEETALAAGKLSDATGLTIQDSSRLQEVAHDLNVNTDSLAGSLVRMQKAVSANSPAVKELGLETKRTKDGQVDVNATFLDAVRKLGDVQNANDKARLASQLFGKGFADSAELILGNADEIKKRLDGVSKAQVISPDDLKKAKEFRDSMDELSDSLKQVEYTTARVAIPIIGDLATALGDVQTAAEKASGAIDKIPGGGSLLDALGTNLFELPKKSWDEWQKLGQKIGIVPDDLAKVRDESDRMSDSVNAGVAAASGLAGALTDVASAAQDAGPQIDRAKDSIGQTVDPLEALRQAARDAIVPIGDVGRTFHDMVGEIRQSNADLATEIGKLRGTIDLGSQLDDITSGFDDITAAAKDMADNVDGSGRKFRDAVRKQQLQLLDLLDQFKQIPAEKRTEIVAEIASGDVDKLNKALDDIIGKDRFVHVGLIMPNIQQAFSGVNVTVAAGGGGNSPTFLNQNPQPAATNNSQTTIIYPVGTTPTGVTVDRRLYDTRNGTSPR